MFLHKINLIGVHVTVEDVYHFSSKTSNRATTFDKDQCPYILITLFNVLEACLIHTLDMYK